jgi:hypothetical protein
LCLLEILLNPAQRSGIRLAEVFNPELFESKLRRVAASYRKRFGDLFEYDVEEELAQFNGYRPKLAKYVVDGVSFIRSAQESNMNIVVEGANVRALFCSLHSYINRLVGRATVLAVSYSPFLGSPLRFRNSLGDWLVLVVCWALSLAVRGSDASHVKIEPWNHLETDQIWSLEVKRYA